MANLLQTSIGTCVSSPIVCGTSCVRSPMVCANSGTNYLKLDAGILNVSTIYSQCILNAGGTAVMRYASGFVQACTCLSTPIVCAAACVQAPRIKAVTGSNQLGIGQWDGSNHRIEGDANLPLLLTSYQGNINMGISGTTHLKLTSSCLCSANIICAASCVRSAMLCSTAIAKADTCLYSPIICAGQRINTDAIVVASTASISGATDNEGLAIGEAYANEGSWNTQLNMLGSAHAILRIKKSSGSTADNAQCLYMNVHNNNPARIISTGNLAIYASGAGVKLCMTAAQTCVTGPLNITTIGCANTCLKSAVVCATADVKIGQTLRFTQNTPYLCTGGAYIVVPSGIYVSGGTLYTENTIMSRNGICDDTGTPLTLFGGNNAEKCTVLCGKTFSCTCLQSPVVCSTTQFKGSCLHIDGAALNQGNDTTVYITSTTNNDWALRVNKNNGSATEYAISSEVGATAIYAYQALFNGTRKFQVSHHCLCHSALICTPLMKSVCICATSNMLFEGTLYAVGGAGGHWDTNRLCAATCLVTPVVYPASCLMFDQTGTRSWKICAGSGRLDILSGDDAGKVYFQDRVVVNGTDDNSGKSDFTVHTGGTAAMALSGGAFKVGAADVNWSVAVRANGAFETYGQNLVLGTQSSGNIYLNPVGGINCAYGCLSSPILCATTCVHATTIVRASCSSLSCECLVVGNWWFRSSN